MNIKGMIEKSLSNLPGIVLDIFKEMEKQTELLEKINNKLEDKKGVDDIENSKYEENADKKHRLVD